VLIKCEIPRNVIVSLLGINNTGTCSLRSANSHRFILAVKTLSSSAISTPIPSVAIATSAVDFAFLRCHTFAMPMPYVCHAFAIRSPCTRTWPMGPPAQDYVWRACRPMLRTICFGKHAKFRSRCWDTRSNATPGS